MPQFFEMHALDTLFFRGSQPMEAGQLHPDILFPPPVTVFQGALRTAYLYQHKIDIAKYNANQVPQSVRDNIGNSGDISPFQIDCILIKKGNILYAPAPYAWFVDSAEKLFKPTEAEIAQGKTCTYNELEIHKAQVATTNISFSGSTPKPPLVRTSNEAQSLGGLWIKLSTLLNQPTHLSQDDLLFPKEIFQQENRIGIGRNIHTGTVETGQLYSSAHLRLLDDVSLVVGISKELDINDTGHLHLGGEQRMVAYTSISNPLKMDAPAIKNPQYFMNLSPILVDQQVMQKAFCTAKTQQIAGWDLHRGFHKPSQTWLPAGSVFSSNIQNQCIAIY